MEPNETAAQALSNFANGPAQTAANVAADAFEVAGSRIADALESAAKSGELSFNSLAQTITRDLASLAINELFTSPLQGLLSGVTSGLSSGLGSILGGGSSGRSSGAGNITLNVSGVSDADSFRRSEGQISASLARAVGQGQRFL